MILALKIAITNIVQSKPKDYFSIVKNYFSAYTKKQIAALPSSIQIEPSSVCNLKCLMCNLDKLHSYNKFLTPADFEYLLSNIPHLQTVNLTGMGEILLNPYLEELFKIAKKHSISLTLVTNLQLLNTKLAKIILQAKTINISLESGIKDQYQNIRLGASYQKLIDNLKLLFKLKLELDYPTKIVFNSVLFESTLADIKQIKSIITLAKKFQIDEVTFQNPHIYKPTKSLVWYRSRFKIIQNFAKQNNIKIRLPNLIPKKNSCYYPWVYPQVTAGGELLPCCLVPQFHRYSTTIENYSYGNVFKQPFSKIWNNKKAQLFRKLNKNSLQNPCINCSKYTNQL